LEQLRLRGHSLFRTVCRADAALIGQVYRVHNPERYTSTRTGEAGGSHSESRSPKDIPLCDSHMCPFHFAAARCSAHSWNHHFSGSRRSGSCYNSGHGGGGSGHLNLSKILRLNTMSFPPPSAPAQEGSGGGAVAAPNGFNTSLFANLIRHWVHYDTAIGDLNKQIKQVRDTRANYESQILTMLATSPLKNPVIQIGGGRLVVATDKQSQPLTYKNIETLLHQYYREKPGAKDETAEILQFIKTRREVSTSQVLRRQRPSISLRSKDKSSE